MGENNVQKKNFPVRNGLRAVWRHVSPFKREIVFLAFLGLISAIANGFIPYITGRFFDTLIALTEGARPRTTVPLWMSELGLWALVGLIALIVDFLGDRRTRRIETKLHLGIQSDGFGHLLHLPLSFHKNERIGQVMSEISMASWRMSAFLRNLANLVPQLLSVLIGITLAASINITLAGILALGVCIYLSLLAVMLRHIAVMDEQAHREWNESWGDASAAVHQIESVKQAAADDYEAENITKRLYHNAFDSWFRLELIWSNIHVFQRIITFIAQLTVFIVSVFFISREMISIGELVAVNGYALMFFGPFGQLGYYWQTIQNALTSSLQAERVFKARTENYIPTGARPLSKVKGDVTFDHVFFDYGDRGRNVLIDINCNVRAGEIVAFVGESGVGKSTAISLISGYYFPTKGEVRIDDIPTMKLKLLELRKHIAVVPQEVALFNDTIGNNIKYGSFDASDSDVRGAARDAHIDTFIETLPQKYNTIVGERGLKLSVGQKQRVSIARAILRSPAILILDEPTSALDAKTEQMITESLEKLMRGRTTFIIAHRLSTVRKADKIFVFEKGKVVEEGKHHDLIAKKDGVYRRLYEYQIGLH